MFSKLLLVFIIILGGKYFVLINYKMKFSEIKYLFRLIIKLDDVFF